MGSFYPRPNHLPAKGDCRCSLSALPTHQIAGSGMTQLANIDIQDRCIDVTYSTAAHTGISSSADYFISQDIERVLVEKWLAGDIVLHSPPRLEWQCKVVSMNSEFDM